MADSRSLADPLRAPAALASLFTLRRSAAAIYRFARGGLALVGLATILFTLFFDVGQVVSASMGPALQGTSWGNGDWVLSENISYRFREPRRWEVVRVRSDDGVVMMKRVGGLPGERVQLIDGRVVINGQPQSPPASLAYLHYFPIGPKVRNGQVADCGQGYFMLGDESKISQDSRYDGPFARDRLLSRAWIRIWPMNRIGWVGP